VKTKLVPFAATLLIAAAYAVLAPPGAGAADPLLSQGKPATASSVENGGTPASAAFDGNTGTRWSSAFSDPQWLQVDLGAPATITQVTLQWEAAYGKAFKLQTSNDAASWTDIYSTTTGTGGTQVLAVSGSGRYVRLYGTVRGTPYGYSLWEFQVYGAVASSCGTNASQGKPATASSVENAATPAGAAFDGNAGTRWSSQFSDPQWIRVDLGTSVTVCQIVLQWETAYGKAFQIQVSPDGNAWTDIYSTTTGTGGTQTLNVNGSGRYVRLYGTVRGTGWGYSLWEFKVLTGGDPIPVPDPKNPDFGPNVTVFDPSMASATIQGKLNEAFAQQETNQFGSQRYAFMFKPGVYSADANLGFYTSVYGLGLSPDDVTLNGHVRVEADWMGGNATQNFWRSAENLSVNPTGGQERWAVAQAAPYRRMHLRGNVQLWNGFDGWASGGYYGDTKVDGQVVSGSQQQWLSRNTEWGSWTGSVWNMVFVGAVNSPPPHFPNPSHTVVDTTPIVREKPFLYLNGSGDYQVFVAALRTNTRGTTWGGGAAPGVSLPITRFFIVKPGTTASTVNAALAAGRDLLFAPGVYHLSETIRITRPDTVVLGLGYPTLIPDNGITALTVSDVDGVKLAGLLVDAGPANSPVLMEVGPSGSAASHAANPTSLHDVFFRVGGAGPGAATVNLIVNSKNVIIDHTWIWRADHGTGVGWTVNPSDTGLIVNGDNVTIYGLFVEHYQKYEVIWNGNGGRTYFFQNEMPYDPPNQAAYMNGSTRGYAAYKVGAPVTTHEAWGLGSYCFFNVDPSVVSERAFEVPDTAGVRFHNMVIVSLGGKGTINHVINNTGGPANSANGIFYLNDYPV
jgi:F5/8 type C domain